MTNFKQVANGVDVSSLAKELAGQPFLWNKNPCRLSRLGPHFETDDIFIRYKDETPNIESGNFKDFSAPHFAEWYKSSDYLPSAKRLAFDVMKNFNGEMLGGVFLYRVDPGKKIYRHTDRGWHPEFYDKFNVCIESNPNAAFCYDGERMIQAEGDVHWFRNDIDHWVVNEGATPHIILTICIRLDHGYRVPWSPEGWTLESSLKQQEAVCQQHG